MRNVCVTQCDVYFLWKIISERDFLTKNKISDERKNDKMVPKSHT